MSGIDEQYLEDIPICPKCGERPAFWILGLEKMEDGWYWLYSEEYISSHNEKGRLEKGGYFSSQHMFDLSDIDFVRCRPVDDHLENYHNFPSGSKMFKEVMRVASKEGVLDEDKKWIRD